MKRTSAIYFTPWFAGVHGYKIPGSPKVTKEEVKNWPPPNNKREPFGYNRVDDFMHHTSEFRKPRDAFNTGPRPDNSGSDKARYTNPPNYTRLHEHFDEYTKPGSDPKVQAVKAVKEYWDASEFYYQGESWKRNRPSFRSVPQEMLNRESWYHYTQFVKNYHKFATTARPRQVNPIWPPPGYQLPEFATKKVFKFGADDPGLIMEIERWAWHRLWIENVSRFGPWEILLWIAALSMMYHSMRSGQDNLNMLKVFAGLYFPGQHSVRAYGEPADPIKEGFWWQQPLETWPNKSEIWYLREVRFGYINYIKKRDAERKAAEEAAAAA
jgi:hypothetical protein